MNENELSQCLSRLEKRIQWLTLATLVLLGLTAALSYDWVQRFRGQQTVRAQSIELENDQNGWHTTIYAGNVYIRDDRKNHSVYITPDEIGWNISGKTARDGMRRMIEIGSHPNAHEGFPSITIFDPETEKPRAIFGCQELDYGDGVRKTLPASTVSLFNEQGKAEKVLP